MLGLNFFTCYLKIEFSMGLKSYLVLGGLGFSESYWYYLNDLNCIEEALSENCKMENAKWSVKRSGVELVL